MKKIIYLLLIIAIVFLSCKTVPKSDEMNLGGYMEQKTDSAPVQRAYQFAMAQMTLTETKLAFVSLQKARTQVVEGTKYELTCFVKKDDIEKTLIVYVYENLMQKQEISEFKYLDK